MKHKEAGILPLDELLAAAREAQRHAYAPYSHFKVGAALRTLAGSVFSGCNVENAAYPVGTCAEAGAIAAMIKAGEQALTEIVVVGDGDGPTVPCGACRQRLFEFAASHTIVHSYGAGGVTASFTLAELLPHAFGPNLLPALPTPSNEADE